MSDISQCIANLSPEKRALLELRFMKKVTLAAKEHKIPRRGATVMTIKIHFSHGYGI
jgi:hypothetical protein